jgi:hypothetical protein
MKTNRGVKTAVLTAVFFCFVSGSVFAVLTGAGTEANPWLIQSRADFDEFANPANAALYWASGKYTKLMCNIDLTDTTYTQAVIAPHTSTSGYFQGTQFTGIFDGNGHTISNLTINQPTKDYIGLFGSIGSGGQVKNLGVENMNITGGRYVGGLSGENYNISITSCYTAGSVRGTSYVGGLIGYNWYGNLKFCYTTVSVYGKDSVGGLIGKNEYSTSLTMCFATGLVSGTGNKIGGLVGENYTGLITYCYATGSVNGISFVGGLSGNNNSGSITSCYATGSVSGTSYVGGLVGGGGGLKKCCFATGAVTGILSFTGGLIGNDGGLSVSCFWDIQTSGISVGVGNDSESSGVNGKTTAEMMDIQTFLNAKWSFLKQNETHGDWIMPNNSYPQLLFERYSPVILPSLKGLTEQQAGDALDALGLVSGESYSVYDVSVSAELVSETYPKSGTVVYTGLTLVHVLTAKNTRYAGGNGTTSPYQITDIGNLLDMINTSADWNKSFILIADIDLAEDPFTQSPIAPDTSTSGNFQGTKFTGIFDGNGHTISNLTINQPTKEYLGLFGYIGIGGLVKNLGVKNVNITGIGLVGGLAGSKGDNYVAGGSIISCHATGFVSGGSGGQVGGLVGSSIGGEISFSHATCSIANGGSGIGGLCGRMENGIINQCYATGSVYGTGNNIGGLIGFINSSSLTACNATGSVTGTLGPTGGLVGANFGTLSFCYSTGPVDGMGNSAGGLAGSNVGSMNACYSTSAVAGDYCVGGLIGSNGGSVTNCYSVGSVLGTGRIGISYYGGLIGSNSGSLKFCYSTGLVEGPGYYVGGLVAWGGGSVRDCFWDMETSGQTTSSGGTGKTMAQMKDIQTYLNAGWSFFQQNETQGDWIMPANDYPKLTREYYTPVIIPSLKGLTESQAASALQAAGFLIGESYFVYDISVAAGLTSGTFPPLGTIGYAGLTPVHILLAKTTRYAGGDGSAASPYQITNPGGLIDMINASADWNKSFILRANLDLSGAVFTQSLIAPDTGSTTGYFQGTKFTGIFDGNGRIISNLTIYAPSKEYIGLFGCIGSNGIIKNLGVNNVNLTGGSYIGGIVGSNGEQSYSSGSIQNCYVTGKIIGDTNIGGLAGQNAGSIKSCYATDLVRAINYAGGLVGSNRGYINSCYTTGAVTGDQNAFYVGGLVGDNSGTLTSCFWDKQTSGKTVGVGSGSSTGVTGKTTAQMKTLSTFTSAGWDFINGTNDNLEHTWFIREGQEYPRLMWEIENGQSGLFPAGFVTVNKTRVGRTSFEYELAVMVRNSNAFAMNNVQMKLMDWDAAVQSVSDDSITIDTIPAGATVISTDTFKIVVDRSILINSSRLVWELTYYTVASGDQVQQAMMSMMLSDIDAGVSGDISGDGKVNFDDFAILAQQWDAAPGNPSADIDPSPDGRVWIEDLMYLAENWMN